MDKAQLIASLLDADPTAAAQVKEHVKPERLRELLGISFGEARLKQLVEDRLRAFDVSTAEWRYVMETLRL